MTNIFAAIDMNSNMLDERAVGYESTHPGQLIREELDERHFTQSKFAQQIGVSPSLLNEVINGKRAVNTEMALLLEAALGISANFWINLQTSYNMQVAKSDSNFMTRLANIRKIAAIL